MRMKYDSNGKRLQCGEVELDMSIALGSYDARLFINNMPIIKYKDVDKKRATYHKIQLTDLEQFCDTVSPFIGLPLELWGMILDHRWALGDNI